MISLLAASSALQNIFLVLAPLVGGVMLAYGVFQVALDLRAGTRRRVIDRLKGDQGHHARTEDRVLADFRRQTVEATGFMAQAFTRLRFTERLQRTLEQANLNWSAPELLVRLTAISMTGMAVILLLGMSWIAAVGLGLATFVLPILYCFQRRRRRLNRLVEQLPDVFEMLSQALRAGHSLASGMQLISREMPDPARTEFGRVFHEQNLGLKIEDALRNLAERVNMLDVRFFVTSVLIQRQTGGDLAEVLDKIGDVIRDRIKLFGTVKALTAEGRLSGYVLLALPVVVFLAMLKVNNEYAMLLLTDPLGKLMLTGALLMQLMGWAMIKKIVNIKV